LNNYNWNKINLLLIIMFKTIVSSILLWLDLVAECAKLGTTNRKHSLTNVVDSKLKRILDLNSKVGTICLSFSKNKILLYLFKMNSIRYILGRQDVKEDWKEWKIHMWFKWVNINNVGWKNSTFSFKFGFIDARFHLLAPNI
jgi:hypothetical protein